MKLIFLDIDGVLNHGLYFEKQSKENINWDAMTKEEWRIKRFFDPESIDILNEITDKTNAKIVISSSWRNSFEKVSEMISFFQKVGITGEVIDRTGTLRFTGIKDYDYSVPRGCEIKAWLEMNKGILNSKISKVKYVILDDDSDMLYWQRNNYFRIDPYCGLTENIAYRVINFLTN